MGERAKRSPELAMERRYRKDKPWDTDDVDHWKLEEWKPEHSPGAFLEESSFATLFPRYREGYIREAWPIVTRTLGKVGVACELNLIEGSMTVATTRKTSDPYVILKARDLIKLPRRSRGAGDEDPRRRRTATSSRSAASCGTGTASCAGGSASSGPTARRSRRSSCSRSATCSPRATRSRMGGIKGLKTCRKVVEECFRNVHPIYNIKILMIKRELANDPELKEEDWERFLPKFAKKNVQTKKPLKTRPTKAYTPFPPAQQPPRSTSRSRAASTSPESAGARRAARR
ncbi:hypothetical protein JL722_15125 [Aureococcus anophagefferens]|nr:hypothetical protein JL722_15125 [Aureococcus anophagefferens]